MENIECNKGDISMDKPTITSGFDRMEKNLTLVDNIISELCDSINPILAEQINEVEDDIHDRVRVDKSPSNSNSLVFNIVNSFNVKLSDIIVRLNSIVDRCQL